MEWNYYKIFVHTFDESILHVMLVTTVFISLRYTQKMELKGPKSLQFQFMSTSLETMGLFICDSYGSSTVVCFLK